MTARPSPVRSMQGGSKATNLSPPCVPRHGPHSIPSRTLQTARNRKEDSDMASREKQLSTLVQSTDPPRGLVAEVVHRLTYPFQRGEAPKPREATGFYTDTTVCIGCKACEVACKQWNQLPSDGFSWSGNSYDNTTELSATSWR